ncbi:MAG: ATP-dependent zinc metalloprotease FtsH [Candidatus Borkfalkiaceae bacterium]|nr:ATP-dependent zinc metalloprotease FtsH [Christensenellaceae bacterium]
METKSNKTIWIILAVILVLVAALSLSTCFKSKTSVDYSEFMQILEIADAKGKNELTKDEVNSITVSNGDSVIKSNLSGSNYTKFEFYEVVFKNYNIDFSIQIITANGGKVVKAFTTNYSRSTEPVSAIENMLLNAGVSFTYTDPNAGSIWSTLMPIFGYVLVAVVFFIIMMQTQGGTKGAMNFAKTNARLNHNLKVRFSDVAGAEEEKAELAEVVDFLKNPRKFSELGARIPKGVLLVGPPGTGKTLFAKAVAGEAGVPFFSISGSDFVEMFVGVGASRVRDLFDAAKKNMPCIVFIDEIDAVGRQRGTGLGGGHDEREQTLNQLLVQMDGFESNDGIIVMAATNRADILDPALLRPGRFDRQIYVNVPDVRGREAILKVHARNKPLSPDVSFKTVARMTSGFSGADLENLLNEAAILAARANRKFITNKDLYEGVNKVLLGPQKKSRLVTETDKRITAYHESGHAILARLLPHCDPVHEVSIIPRGQAAGYTMTRPDNDDNHLTKAKLLDDIVMTLGGRVAEELIIKDISAGASGDIQAVSKRARLMVTEWGMSEKVGPISYASDKEVFIGRDMASHVSYSEETAAIIDEEVRDIIESSLAKARELLKTHKNLLDNMARLLVERETIFSEEVDMLMEGKSPEEVMAFMDENEQKLSENPFERKSNPVIIKEKPAKEQPATDDGGAKKSPRRRSDKTDNSEKAENSENTGDEKKD